MELATSSALKEKHSPGVRRGRGDLIQRKATISSICNADEELQGGPKTQAKQLPLPLNSISEALAEMIA